MTDVNPPERDDLLARLQAKVSALTEALDRQHGTPCEQIRHEQERDALRAQLAHVTADLDKMREDFLTSSAQAVKALADLAQVTAERDRLRPQLADLRGMLIDARVHPNLIDAILARHDVTLRALAAKGAPNDA